MQIRKTRAFGPGLSLQQRLIEIKLLQLGVYRAYEPFALLGSFAVMGRTRLWAIPIRKRSSMAEERFRDIIFNKKKMSSIAEGGKLF
uniref:Uncharacterized protein n=1 Tax=Romanomermis culicivorax TaxID=13658 RepID=A0A915JE99_ROMCU